MSASDVPNVAIGHQSRRFSRPSTSMRVLVVSPSGFVRIALTHRLADLNAVVTLAVRREDAPDDDYDAFIVGPYLTDKERDRIVDDVASSEKPAVVIEICDPPENGSARLIAMGHNRLAEIAEVLLAAVGDQQGALAEA
jgi:hypothetical protein